MGHGGNIQVDARFAIGEGRQSERLALRWAIPAICGLAALGWAAVLIPLVLLLD